MGRRGPKKGAIYSRKERWLQFGDYVLLKQRPDYEKIMDYWMQNPKHYKKWMAVYLKSLEFFRPKLMRVTAPNDGDNANKIIQLHLYHPNREVLAKTINGVEILPPPAHDRIPTEKLSDSTLGRV